MSSSKSLTLYIQMHITNFLLAGNSIKHTKYEFDRTELYEYILSHIPPVVNPGNVCSGLCGKCSARNMHQRDDTWFTCSLLVYIKKVLHL